MDEAEIDQLIKHYYDQVYSYVYRITDEKFVTLDLTQEIFIKVFENITKYKKGNFQGWLFTIAHNHVMSFYHTKQYKTRKNETELLDIFCTNFDFEEQLITKECYFNLAKAINLLNIKYKEVIIMKYYQELSSKEIAEKLMKNENTIKTRLKRGLSQLRKILEGNDLFE